MSYAITQPYPYTTGNITVTGTSGSSSIFTIGVNGTSATDLWTNTSWTTAAPSVNVSKRATLDLQGEDADVVINGKSLSKTLEGIQERLGLLEMNTELEAEFDELREAADRYRELEKKFKEQKRVWDTLKKQDL
jgi:hypothetical protein